MKRAEPADILKVLIAFSPLAVVGIGELRAQSCTATAYEHGASFAGQSFVSVEVLPSFGGMQATVEAAVSEAISLWNAGCTGSHAWPLFVSGSSFTSKIAIISTTGRANQATGTCPNGAASYPPAAIAQFTYNGVSYPQGIVVFAESGCEGSMIQTLDPSSPYQQGDNLTNLFAHEIGHHVGLGHNDCPGVMNGDGKYLYDGTRKGITPEDCAMADEVNTPPICSESTSGLTTKSDHCPDDPIGGLPGLCQRVPELCGGGSGPGSPWWLHSETKPTCWLEIVTTTDNFGNSRTTTRRVCDALPKGGEVAPTTASDGPMTAFRSPAEGALVRQDLQITGWSRDDLAGLTGTLGFWVDRAPVFPAGVTYGISDSEGCSGSTDPNCPFVGFSASLDSTQLADGPHTLEVVTAQAVAEKPTPGYGVVSFTVDNTPPTASITSPAAGATVSGTVQVKVSAADAFGIDGVGFSVNGVHQAWDSTAPYTFSWNTTGGPNGSHTLRARVWDQAGNERSVQIGVTVANSVAAPQVALSQPAAGALLRGSVLVEAQASGPQGISHVELYFNGAHVATRTTAPYRVTWNTANWPDGAYSLSARAFDPQGNSSQSAPVSVTVDNTVPKLFVDNPKHLQAVGGTSVRISGWAIDASRVVAYSFTLDGQPLALNGAVATGISRPDVCSAHPDVGDPDCPYVGWQAFFDATRFANGSHTLGVTAHDGAGNTKTFNRSFFISNPPVTATFHPVADATAWQAYPTYNDGSSQTLFTRTTSGGQGAYAFLKFQVSGVTGTVTGARLHVRALDNMWDLWLYWLLHSNWTEWGLTWNSFPGPGGSLDHQVNLVAGAWYSFDVGGFVTGNGTYSLGFAGSNPSYAAIWSRESAYKPVLEVTYQP